MPSRCHFSDDKLCCLTHRHRSACHHFTVSQECVVSFLLPYHETEQSQLMPRGQLWKLVKFFLKHNELVQAVCSAHLLCGPFPSDSAGFPAGRAKLITFNPTTAGESVIYPLTLAGDDPPGRSSTMRCGKRSSKQDF